VDTETPEIDDEQDYRSIVLLSRRQELSDACVDPGWRASGSALTLTHPSID
jgi:hypothetical protein